MEESANFPFRLTDIRLINPGKMPHGFLLRIWDAEKDV